MSTMERILRLMADKKASDVYLAVNSPVLIKINGECIPVNSQLLPVDGPRSLLAEIVTPRDMETLQETGELNIGVPLQGVGRFRISAMHQRGSIAVVIRFISQHVPSLASLQLPEILGDLILQKRGLLLVVGSTGSGKSTTLAAMIDRRSESMSGHILTIEDPIEFQFHNKKSIVNQREVGTDTQSMQIALKNALRQAPDVILIGEIRDRETMSAAIAYAQSGHLCLATLHGNNSYHALNRILSFYPVEAPHPAGRFVLVPQSGHYPAPGAHRRRRAHCRGRGAAQHQAGVRIDRKRRLLRRARLHGKIHGRRLANL